ncbi:MAG TPA: tetratricopeptide repeat protein [Patescibacteria group bacterium]|nr:tetratricopeptide repeat protein [Patescibacteria group bacterium]
MKVFCCFLAVYFCAPALLPGGAAFCETSSSGQEQAANDYFQQGDYHKAIREYEALLEQGFKHPQIYNNLGLAYTRSGESYVKAVESFKNALALDPQYTEAYANMGLAYIGKEDYPSAIKSFEDLLKINPDYAKGYFGLGWAYLMGKMDNAKALQAFEKALRIDPALSEAYLGLGLAFVAQGQKQMALEPITTLRRMGRDDFANMLETAMRAGAQALQESLKKNPF